MRIHVIALLIAFAAPAWSATRTATLSVPDMSCATCPITIKVALKRLAGVTGVKSRLDVRETQVVFDDAQVTLEAITRSTKEAGFPSEVLKVTP